MSWIVQVGHASYGLGLVTYQPEASPIGALRMGLGLAANHPMGTASPMCPVLGNMARVWDLWDPEQGGRVLASAYRWPYARMPRLGEALAGLMTAQAMGWPAWGPGAAQVGAAMINMIDREFTAIGLAHLDRLGALEAPTGSTERTQALADALGLAWGQPLPTVGPWYP